MAMTLQWLPDGTTLRTARSRYGPSLRSAGQLHLFKSRLYIAVASTCSRPEDSVASRVSTTFSTEVIHIVIHSP